MQVVLDKVPQIIRYIENSGYNDLREFQELVEDEVYSLYRDEFKLRFLSEVYEQALEARKQHQSKCTLKGTCFTEKRYDIAEFFLQQEIDKLTNDINLYGEFNRFNVGIKGERFSDSDIVTIHEKLDKLHMGQEAIYDDLKEEITELKELIYILNKKNWVEIFKGKLTGFGINQGLSVAMKGTLDTLGFDKEISGLLS